MTFKWAKIELSECGQREKTSIYSHHSVIKPSLIEIDRSSENLSLPAIKIQDMKVLSVCLVLSLFVACETLHSDSGVNYLSEPDDVIRLMIHEPIMDKLRAKRVDALELGKLLRADGDWVNGVIVYKGKSNRVKIRLKGDLADHWSHEKEWSFKVKLEGKNSIEGMSRFALQRPTTRGFLNEWYLHKFLSYTGLIALNYNFVEVAINGDVLPIYAIEENLHSSLIKRHGKPKGILFKFDGDFYWHHKPGLASKFYGTQITPFQVGAVKKDAVLSDQLNYVRSNIDKFRREELKTHEIFDCEQMAKLFVAIDIMGHHHATTLDNIRFYYNSDTKLIEPIGYDNQLISKLSTQGLLGANKTANGHHPLAEWNYTNGYWYQYLFADTLFMKAYIKQLALMSQTEYMDEFIGNTDKEFEEKLDLIRQSYPEYEFTGKEVLYANQQYIRTELEKLKLNAELHVTEGVSKAYSTLINTHTGFAVKDTVNRKKEINEALNRVPAYSSLALLDILGCSTKVDLLSWLSAENHQLNLVKHEYKSIGQDIMGTSHAILGEPLSGYMEKHLIYIDMLQVLCETADFERMIKNVPWFNTYYQDLDDSSKQIIDQNRVFLLKYLSPYKAVKAAFIGTDSLTESIVLEVQNIHKLPLELSSITINGQSLPFAKPQLLRGYIEGQPLIPVRFQVTVGASLLPIFVRVVDDRLFELEQFELNYSVYGMDSIITESIKQQ